MLLEQLKWYCSQQRSILGNTITQSRGSVDLTDDMLIIGFKV